MTCKVILSVKTLYMLVVLVLRTNSRVVVNLLKRKLIQHKLILLSYLYTCARIVVVVCRPSSKSTIYRNIKTFVVYPLHTFAPELNSLLEVQLLNEGSLVCKSCCAVGSISVLHNRLKNGLCVIKFTFMCKSLCLVEVSLL